MTSVFNDKGRVVPCNFKNKPQALHKVLPSVSFRHKGVFSVLQLKQEVFIACASVSFFVGSFSSSFSSVEPVFFSCFNSFNFDSEDVKFDFGFVAVASTSDATLDVAEVPHALELFLEQLL